MKRFIPRFLVLLALLIGYWAWPFFDLRALAAALQAGDVTAINEEVDYTPLRRSFTDFWLDCGCVVARPTAQKHATICAVFWTFS